MKVRLIKGLSYTTPSFSCKKGKDVTVSEELGEKLLKTGRFESVAVEDAEPEAISKDEAKEAEDGGTGNNNDGECKELTAEVIEKMKKDELLAVAAERGIDISDCKNNDERADRIKGALGLVNMSALFPEE